MPFVKAKQYEGMISSLAEIKTKEQNLPQTQSDAGAGPLTRSTNAQGRQLRHQSVGSRRVPASAQESHLEKDT